MWRLVKDLSSDQRVAIESLLGRSLREDEGVNVQPVQVLKDAPVGEARTEAYGRYLADLDRLSARAAEVPEDELDSLIESARKQ